MVKSLELNDFQLGVCYYPEQWPAELWEADYARMRELGFKVVRLAEFAWSIFEPAEGVFSFELFDRALELAHRAGLKVIMGTPTATPPAWLSQRYPEILNVSQEGVIYQHGQRRHYNYNSPIYRQFCARIVTQLAQHYHDHPAVIGWQIDNELNCEINVFYSPADQQAFRQWLQNRYGELANLNEAWGTVFWNQTYSDWEQVRLTGPTPSASPNPHQALDEKRFISDSVISFVRLQTEILRRLAPNQWITTNGIFGHLDSQRLTEELLDFISYDSYPNFSTIYPDAGDRPLLDRGTSYNLSAVRAISPNFAILEQQAGPGGWVNRILQPSPQPGQLRLWTYQSVAHGADMLLYFRWRTATRGTEIYWYGLNDWDNRPNRRLAEAGRVSRELAALGPRLVGTRYQAQVALVRDYANEWDGEFDLSYGPLEKQSTPAWFKALQRAHIGTDVLHLSATTDLAALSRYEVLIYPHPAIVTEPVAQLLAAYVEQGGKLVLGCRSAYKNEAGHCYMQPTPGPLSELCGLTVADFSLIGPQQSGPRLTFEGETVTYQSLGFIESLEVAGEQAEILARYSPGHYFAGAPALVRNHYGEGQVYYYGSAFSEEIARRLLRDYLDQQSLLAERLELPEEVELAVRQAPAEGRWLIFLLNYASSPVRLNILAELTDLLDGQKRQGQLTLEPFGVMVLGETQ